MIGFVRGVVAGRGSDHCFIDVQGVGYRLQCSSTTLAGLPRDDQTTRLWTHVHVREDALALFGFSTEVEKRMFEGLLSVSGVGPKVALQVCSALTPEAFRRALVTGDVDAISAVPGIGKKTAQRILLDLKERLNLPDLDVVGAVPDQMSKARSALENLGYSPTEIRTALADADPGDVETVEDVIKAALKVLA